jgi:hypothetical protein
MALLSACSSPMVAPAPVVSAAPAVTAPPRPGAPVTTATLATPGAARNWDELRLQAARRLVAANPEGTYVGTVPDMLLAIPVLEIELNRDGSIRRIEVMRKPTQALDTIEIAMDAVRRAAPFGDVSRLPKPWKFTETFLFNDVRKFKPRTLDN